jgi:hypothetical protein
VTKSCFDSPAHLLLDSLHVVAVFDEVLDFSQFFLEIFALPTLLRDTEAGRSGPLVLRHSHLELLHFLTELFYLFLVSFVLQLARVVLAHQVFQLCLQSAFLNFKLFVVLLLFHVHSMHVLQGLGLVLERMNLGGFLALLAGPFCPDSLQLVQPLGHLLAVVLEALGQGLDLLLVDLGGLGLLLVQLVKLPLVDLVLLKQLLLKIGFSDIGILLPSLLLLLDLLLHLRNLLGQLLE